MRRSVAVAILVGVGLGLLWLNAPTTAQNRDRAYPVRTSALTNSSVTVVGSSVALDTIQCWNPGSIAYLQVFNTTGTVTVGTTLPTLSFGMAASGTLGLVGLNMQMAAVKVAATTTATGSSAPSTSLDCNFMIR